jgi:hypothetical protein
MVQYALRFVISNTIDTANRSWLRETEHQHNRGQKKIRYCCFLLRQQNMICEICFCWLLYRDNKKKSISLHAHVSQGWGSIPSFVTFVNDFYNISIKPNWTRGCYRAQNSGMAHVFMPSRFEQHQHSQIQLDTHLEDWCFLSELCLCQFHPKSGHDNKKTLVALTVPHPSGFAIKLSRRVAILNH